jgi:sugar-specific transcriptional regulator TrmB
MHLTPLLEQFGFSEKEAEVYLTCLELGQAPVSSIARTLHQQRENTYYILKNLVTKGIAQSFVKNRSTFYSVLPPKKLLQNQKAKCERFEERLPEFLALAEKFDNKPKVQFYEGLEGLKHAYRQVVIEVQEMEHPEPVLSFLGTKEIDTGFQQYLIDERIPRRMKTEVKARVIIPKQSLSQEYGESNANRNDHIIIDEAIFDMTSEIAVYGEDKVVMLMYHSTDLSALVITSKPLHNGFKNIHNLLWKAYEHKKS